MTTNKDSDKKRQLHDINTRIYSIIDDLNDIDAPVPQLTYQDLRNATKNIQLGIANLIDKETVKEDKG